MSTDASTPGPDGPDAAAPDAAASHDGGDGDDDEFGSLLSANPGRRATERYWLYYTPVWAGITALLMVGGFVEQWGDLACMLYGVALGAGTVAGPLFIRVPEERGVPLHRRAGVKLALSVVGFSFALNYSQTPFFFDVLHMHFGFGTNLNIQHNPVFLYFLTIAYFATYCVLCCATFRGLRRIAARRRSRAIGAAAYVIAPIAIAFLEASLNANPFTRTLFCYDDMRLVLGFGTLCYAMAFVFALPMWMAIDDVPGRCVRASSVLVWLFAAVYADVLMLEIVRYHLAPHVTTVLSGHNGLRDVGGTSCLQPIVRP